MNNKIKKIITISFLAFVLSCGGGNNTNNNNEKKDSPQNETSDNKPVEKKE